MRALKQYIRKELDHYNTLSRESRTLFNSYFLFSLVNPLIGTFTSVFLWRSSHSLLTVTAYNIAVYAGLPLGFLINGMFLKHMPPVRLFRYGIILQSVIALIIFFLAPTSVTAILTLGLLFGAGSGLYWANRNFLTILTTKRHNRVYFASLETASGTIVGIVIPLLIGGFIYLGESLHLYAVSTAYHILSVITFIVLFFAGRMVRGVKVDVPALEDVPLYDPRHLWQRTRVAVLLWGALDGIFSVIPTLIVIVLVGAEGSLGTLQSVAAVVSSIVVYVIARAANPHFRARYILVGTIFLLVGSVLFGHIFTSLGVLILFGFVAVGKSIGIIGFGPLTQDIIEIEERNHTEHHYSYIFDQEVFYNIGRISALLAFMMVCYFSETAAIRYSPLVVTLSQSVLVIVAASLSRDVKPHHHALDDVEEVH